MADRIGHGVEGVAGLEVEGRRGRLAVFVERVEDRAGGDQALAHGPAVAALERRVQAVPPGRRRREAHDGVERLKLQPRVELELAPIIATLGAHESK